YAFGNVYQAAKTPVGNASRFFWSLIGTEERRKLWEVITREEFDDAEARITDALASLDRARMKRPDASLIADEIRNAAAMLRFACGEGRWRLGDDSTTADQLARTRDEIVAEHRRLWLGRNRGGGLDDSCARLSRPITR